MADMPSVDIYEQLETLENIYVECTADHSKIKQVANEIMADFVKAFPDGLDTPPNSITRGIILQTRTMTASKDMSSMSYSGSPQWFVMNLLSIIWTLADFGQLAPRDAHTSILRGRSRVLFLRAIR
jgi:hypothetical protein